jgi:hypothetical protein
VYQIFKATILDVAMQNMTPEVKIEQAGSQNPQKIKSESMLSNGLFRPDCSSLYRYSKPLLQQTNQGRHGVRYCIAC